MKKLSVGILLLFFALINYLSQTISDKNMIVDTSYFNSKNSNDSISKDVNTKYNFDIKFNVENNNLSVKQEIIWRNNCEKPIDTLFMELEANIYNSKNSKLFTDKNIDDDFLTNYDIKSISADNIPIIQKYFTPDSTLLRLILKKPILPSKNLTINISYDLKVPRSFKEFGFADNKNFFFLDDWYPRLSKLNNGNWEPRLANIHGSNYYDFADYRAKVSVSDNNYKICSNGNFVAETEPTNNIYHFSSKHSKNLIFSLYTEKIDTSFTISIGNRRTEVEMYIQSYRERYIDRYKKILTYSIGYLTKKLGEFPFQKLIVLDVPRTSNADISSYPGVITVSPELISPIEMHSPEFDIAYKLAQQYLVHSVINDETEAKFDSYGLSEFLAGEIMYKYYPEAKLYFPVNKYYPISGIEFLSYNEIPIIYTLGSFYSDRLGKALSVYYQNPSFGMLSDSLESITEEIPYKIQSIYKPDLLFCALKRSLGEERFFNILNDFYSQKKISKIYDKNLLKNMFLENSDNTEQIFNEFYYTNNIYDYAIHSLSQVSPNVWEIIVKRNFGGAIPLDVALITENDTIYQSWNGKSSFKTFKFKTNDEVIAAEVDPLRKNVFDMNFNNNSKTVSPRYWASISLSINWFFWVQNALMILGSMG